MRKYKVGNLYKVCEGSGLSSNKIVKIIPWFYWRDATDGTYKNPDKKESVAVLYENGEKGFMFKNRLIRITDEDLFDAKL